MPLHADGPAPYAPPSAVTTVISGYRLRGYATPFTPDVLVRAGVSESLATRTLQALRLLDLIDDKGSPTPQFDTLKSIRGEEEYKEELAKWLRGVYKDVLQYADPMVDPLPRLVEAFRGFKPEGQRERMVTLMLGLYEYAGLIEPGTAVREPRPPRRTSPTLPKSRAKSEPATNTSAQVAAKASTSASDGLPPQLVGLLHAIPRDGEGWSMERRDKFLVAFTSVLDFSVPINIEPVPAPAADYGDDDP